MNAVATETAEAPELRRQSVSPSDGAAGDGAVLDDPDWLGPVVGIAGMAGAAGTAGVAGVSASTVVQMQRAAGNQASTGLLARPQHASTGRSSGTDSGGPIRRTPTLQRDAPKEGTPAGDLAAMKADAKTQIDATRKEALAKLLEGIDTLVAQAPAIAKEPAETMQERLAEGANAWADQITKQLTTWLAQKATDIANSDVGKSVQKSLKDAHKDINDNEISRAVFDEVVRLLKEIYEHDRATIVTKLDLGSKAGQLEPRLVVANVTSGLRSVAADVALVRKELTAKISYKDGKLAFDMSAALAADAALKAHIDEKGGSITFTLSDEEGKVHTIPATVDASGKGTAEVPKESEQVAIEAAVDAAAKIASAKASYSYAAYAADPNRPGAIKKTDALTLEAELFSSFGGKDYGAKVAVDYQDRVVTAAIKAAVANAEGKTKAEVSAEVSVAINSAFSVTFGAKASVGGGETTLGGNVGLKHNPSGLAIGAGFYTTIPSGPGREPQVLMVPSISGNLPGIIPGLF